MQKKLGSMAAVAVWLALIAYPACAAREYWVAADEVQWDYAPSFPVNVMSGKEFTAEQRVFVEQGIGRRYLKSIYSEYTQGFRALKQRSAEE